jgi:hypothetical protein
VGERSRGCAVYASRNRDEGSLASNGYLDLLHLLVHKFFRIKFLQITQLLQIS